MHPCGQAVYKQAAKARDGQWLRFLQRMADGYVLGSRGATLKGYNFEGLSLENAEN